MVLALLVITALMVLGVMFASVRLTVTQVVNFTLVGILGVVPFCALGLLIGT